MKIKFSFSAWEIAHSCRNADYCAQTMCDGIHRTCEHGTCANTVFGYFQLLAKKQVLDNWVLCEYHFMQTTDDALEGGMKWRKPQLA